MNINLAKHIVFVLGLIPLLRLFVLGYMDDLTANPIEFITRSTGT
ncbi:MAG: sulfoxide reductase heme-binding subunit YedZ, partial [Candidatus Fonsibacter sp.]